MVAEDVHAFEETGIRVRSAFGLAAAAALAIALAGCGRSGDTASEITFNRDGIRTLTGLSAPLETPEAAQERNLDIFGRADSLILSTMHGETGDAGVPAFRLLTRCGGARCTVTEPLSGTVDTIGLANTPLRQGAATALGSKHGITLRIPRKVATCLVGSVSMEYSPGHPSDDSAWRRGHADRPRGRTCNRS